MQRVTLFSLGRLAGVLVAALATGVRMPAAIAPFRILQTTEARFPPSLLADAVRQGEVWVMLSVGADGKLLDAMATRYTHPALATEALAAVRVWRYEAARDNGRPIAARAEVHFRFAATGAILSMDARATLASLTAFAGRPIYVTDLCHPSELDDPPVALRTVSPRFPASSARTGDAPATVIDFIIDETGRPRMPVLVSSPGPEFAEEAAQALAQWRFSPPRRNGRPVAVPARQEFLAPVRS